MNHTTPIALWIHAASHIRRQKTSVIVLLQSGVGSAGSREDPSVLDSFRQAIYPFAYAIVWCLYPVKMFAWRTRWGLLRRLILEVTTFIDWSLLFATVQNETMVLHHKVYGGNFIFGKGVMVTDHATMKKEIQHNAFRGNNFMGVHIVSSTPDVFATNAGILNQCPPYRDASRRYLDEAVFTPEVMAFTIDDVNERCGDILDDWASHPRMANFMVLRSAVSRMFYKLLSDVTVSVEDAEATTWAYLRRFAEASMFGRYFQFVLGLLGTRKYIRKDAYLKLHRYGIDVAVIDISLFAAMFSVGTHVVRCVDDIRDRGIPYDSFDYPTKRNFVIEALRINPTVTSVHRIVEDDELVHVGGKEVMLTGGDEVVYPFVCAHADPKVFPNPHALDWNRPQEAYDDVLSWSKGPHSCPAKELSILVVIAMLDRLSERHDLSRLKIFSPMF